MGGVNVKFCQHHEQWEIFAEKVMRKRLGSYREGEMICLSERRGNLVTVLGKASKTSISKSGRGERISRQQADGWD